MYTWISLQSQADLRQLEAALESEYAPARVAQTLSAGISAAVKGILVESDYTDKDYRSTYYSFYAKKGQRYRADCVRLHFFDGTVTFDSEKLELSCPEGVMSLHLQEHYFGYMVLRPTGIATIGRTVLSPKIRRGAGGLVITADHKAHVLGHKLRVAGFPSMDQHIDIAVCAHVACWSILRHYSERYSIYREFLTHDITMMAHEFDPGGIVPSKGLTVNHAERVFQAANTYPITVARGVARDSAFYRQMMAYVESGFPVFAALHSRGHAVAVIGYQRKEMSKRSRGLRYSWDEVKSLSVVDDNYLPYLTIPVTRRGESPYAASEIDTLVVALPEKIFYPADAVDQLAPTLFDLKKILAFPRRSNCVIRYFVTTVSALRTFVRDRVSEFGPELVNEIMQLPSAQFVWIVEYSTHAQWAVGQVAVRAIVDATASLQDDAPFWLLHDTKTALVFDRARVADPDKRMSVQTLSGIGHSGFTRMDRNLRPTQAS